MKLSQTYSMNLKRRRRGKTDYKKRRNMLKSGKPRLVARIKNKTVIAQVIKYKENGDQVEASAVSTELKQLGFKKHPSNTTSAYLTGFMCGKRALDQGIKECNLDIGLHTPVTGSKVFAVLKGAIDAGMNIKHNEKCFPKEERLDKETIEKIKTKIKPGKKPKKKTTKKKTKKKKTTKKKTKK